MSEISIIIPNYNGLRFMPDCINALKNQTYTDFEIIIVDNGSTDGSIGWISGLQETGQPGQTAVSQARQPDKFAASGIRLIRFDENTGFSAAVNAGIKAAKGKYVLLLNNDTVPFPDFVQQLKTAIEADERLFAVSAQMIKASDHRLIDSAGDGITWLGWAYQRGIDEAVEKYNKEKSVFSACAGAAIYRREAFDSIGYFDEKHFAYLEDIDVSWRARLYGYDIRYCPRAKVYHLGSATSGSRYNSFKVRLSTRNNIYLQYKNQPALQLVINFIPLALGVAGKALFFKRMGFIEDYKAGLKEGLDTRKTCTRAPKAKLCNYLKVEGMMLTGLIEYGISFIKRHI